ncbi:sensor histidine kinase [Naasia lichenicola]|nr:histidine kinase [Naasia lichenicola]
MNDKNWAERVAALLTRENLVRHRAGVEWLGAGVYFLLGLIAVVGRFNAVIALLVVLGGASLIVLHRRAPGVALLGGYVLVVVVSVLLGGGYAEADWGVIGLPLLVVMFGSAAYGRAPIRWGALGIAAIAVLAAQVGLVFPQLTDIGGFGYGYTFMQSAGFLGSAAFVFVGTCALLLLPWFGGWLSRTAAQRKAAETGKVEIVAQRDELEVSVALEQERNRVARDVHDIVAHSLAVVISQADGARYAARKSPEAVDDALEAISATARAALVDVRSLLTDLRHSQEAGPQPGMNDIDNLVRSFRESGLEVEWSSYGVGRPVSEATGLGVYRIVQESLTNALRHGARTSPVDLEFDWSETALSITVTNDLSAGERAQNAAGHGIPGMRERSALAGGAFTMGDGTNGRFRIRAVLPVDRGTARTQPMATLRTASQPIIPTSSSTSAGVTS